MKSEQATRAVNVWGVSKEFRPQVMCVVRVVLRAGDPRVNGSGGITAIYKSSMDVGSVHRQLVDALETAFPFVRVNGKFKGRECGTGTSRTLAAIGSSGA